MDFSQLLGSYAFPIVACIAMAYYVIKQSASYKEDFNNLHDRHKDEIIIFKDAINNNTNVMQKLCDKLGDKLGKEEI